MTQRPLYSTAASASTSSLPSTSKSTSPTSRMGQASPSTSPPSAFNKGSYLQSASNGAAAEGGASGSGRLVGAKSYASVASSASGAPSLPALPLPSYSGVGLGQQAHQSAFHAQRPHGLAWAPYPQSSQTSPSQALPPRAKTITTTAPTTYGDVDDFGPSSSLSKQPPQLAYKSSFQDSEAALANGVLNRPRPSYDATTAATSIVGVAAPSQAAAPHGSAGAAYHPYRRVVRPSDSGTSLSPSHSSSSTTSTISQTPPVLPMLSHVAPVGVPAFPERARGFGGDVNVTSTPDSNPTQRREEEASTAVSSYSSIASGGMRPSQSTPNLAAYTAPIPTPVRTESSLQDRPAFTRMNSSQTSVNRVKPEAPTSSHRSDAQAPPSSASSYKPTHQEQPYASSYKPSGVATPAVSHNRTESTSSSANSSDYSHSSGNTTTTTARSGISPIARKPVPSPLARKDQNNDSTDTAYAGSDDENTIGGRSTPTPGEKQKQNLSGKLRKALSLSTLQQVEAAAAAPDRAYGGRAPAPSRRGETSSHPHSSGDTNGSSGSTRSTSPPPTPDNGASVKGSSATSIRSARPPLSNADGASSKRSLFRSKFNASTDNISISSTVSSASMMLRKVGNLGKFARKSNLKGITNIFKDKEDGRGGLHGDDFGTLPVATDEVAAASAGKKDRFNFKKSSPASAAVSHATAELDQGTIDSEGMTPAASYVRQHQLQMRKQAEAERAAQKKAEAERAAAAARQKSKTTDDVTESRQKMIEKEKERLKNKRGWKKRLGVGSFGSSSEASQVTGLETVPVGQSSDATTPHDVPGGYSVPPSGHGQAQMQQGSGAGFNEMSYDSAFGDEDLEPPQRLADGYESGGDEFETDSLRHWGEGIERSRESAARVRQFRGILKNSANSSLQGSPRISQAVEVIDQPQGSRMRSNSYDAPQAPNATTAVPALSHITAATTDRVDGVAHGGESGDQESMRARSPDVAHGGGIGHHSNTSMPTLTTMMHPGPTGQRSVTAPVARKRIIFADSHIYHSTWPAHVYDRRGELATCNRLTPLLAQRIKEELNTYKMEEMAVAPSSRIHTHFFV